MSTDIIHFDRAGQGKSNRVFQLNALQLYLAISLPLMFMTFLVWAGFHWLEKRREKNREIEYG